LIQAGFLHFGCAAYCVKVISMGPVD